MISNCASEESQERLRTSCRGGEDSVTNQVMEQLCYEDRGMERMAGHSQPQSKRLKAIG